MTGGPLEEARRSVCVVAEGREALVRENQPRVASYDTGFVQENRPVQRMVHITAAALGAVAARVPFDSRLLGMLSLYRLTPQRKLTRWL